MYVETGATAVGFEYSVFFWAAEVCVYVAYPPLDSLPVVIFYSETTRLLLVSESILKNAHKSANSVTTPSILSTFQFFHF